MVPSRTTVATVLSNFYEDQAKTHRVVTDLRFVWPKMDKSCLAPYVPPLAVRQNPPNKLCQ